LTNREPVKGLKIR